MPMAQWKLHWYIHLAREFYFRHDIHIIVFQFPFIIFSNTFCKGGYWILSMCTRVTNIRALIIFKTCLSSRPGTFSFFKIITFRRFEFWSDPISIIQHLELPNRAPPSFQNTIERVACSTGVKIILGREMGPFLPLLLRRRHRTLFWGPYCAFIN